jgi:hypothetical protein
VGVAVGSGTKKKTEPVESPAMPMLVEYMAILNRALPREDGSCVSSVHVAPPLVDRRISPLVLAR